MKKINIYLTGAMSAYYYAGEYEKAKQWRDYAKQKLRDCDFGVFDPTDNSEIHFKYPTYLNSGVIFQNYTYLKNCDILLVNLDKIEDSIGSIWEISMAWAEHKPIVAFGRCDKWKERPHFQSMISVILDNVETACDYILTMYNQKI